MPNRLYVSTHIEDPPEVSATPTGHAFVDFGQVQVLIAADRIDGFVAQLMMVSEDLKLKGGAA